MEEVVPDNTNDLFETGLVIGRPTVWRLPVKTPAKCFVVVLDGPQETDREGNALHAENIRCLKRADGVDIVVKTLQDLRGIRAVCGECNKELARGGFVVSVRVLGIKYLFPQDPEIGCCGESKRLPWIFASRSGADALAEELLDILRHSGAAEALALLPFHQFLSAEAGDVCVFKC